jgi:hypothetical protein
LADAAPLIGRLAANAHLQLGYMAKPSSKSRGGRSSLQQSVRSVAATCGDVATHGVGGWRSAPLR